MKKIITLTSKDGLVYAVTLNASLVDGQVEIESCVKTAQLFGTFKPCMEKTLSVKAENGSRKYLISLIKVEDSEFEAVIDDITLEKVKPLWQVIAGKSKLSLAVYDEIRAISVEFAALSYSILENTQNKEAGDAVLDSMYRTMFRSAAKLSDSIHKQNTKNGVSYSVEDFVSAVIQ